MQMAWVYDPRPGQPDHIFGRVSRNGINTNYSYSLAGRVGNLQDIYLFLGSKSKVSVLSNDEIMRNYGKELGIVIHYYEFNSTIEQEKRFVYYMNKIAPEEKIHCF